MRNDSGRRKRGGGRDEGRVQEREWRKIERERERARESERDR